MKLVCIDTQVLIWGLKAEAEAGQDAMIPRARQFFEDLAGSGERGLIPSVVAGEFLTRIPVEQHPLVMNLLRQSFVTGVYDLKAASAFADLWRRRKLDGTVASLQADGAKREELKADGMIVATALASGADRIISHDGYVGRFAGGSILVAELPLLRATQQNLAV